MNLGNLRDRIIREVNRDELTDPVGDDRVAANSETLDLVIAQAIEYYADSRFSFNESIVPTFTNGEFLTLPTGMRKIDAIIVNDGTRYGLRVRDYVSIQTWQQNSNIYGRPTDYAVSAGSIRFFPFPRPDIAVTIMGVLDQQALDYTSDESQNAWTNEGQDLIVARTKMLLFRDYFRDVDQAAIAAGAEQQALTKLRGYAAQMLGTGRIRGAW